MRANAEMRHITFDEVDIRHRMAPMQTFSCNAFAITKLRMQGIPRQICLDSHDPCRGVAIVLVVTGHLSLWEQIANIDSNIYYRTGHAPFLNKPHACSSFSRYNF